MHLREWVHATGLAENVKEIDNHEDLSVDGRRVLKFTIDK
jgi:hypothetical protein